MKYVLLSCILLMVSTAIGQAPGFEPSYRLQCAGTDIDVGYYGAPFVVDWDGDTVQDLILGQFTNGYIRFYKNEGTNEAPVLNSFSYLQADGANISMGYG
ncbi:MAG: hypothetical protein GF388_01885 [Candidatus Aegiribacteria sp.]|nr:hypothetical protein [Candidatus Aegiribacteria sp.]MBD3294108.1 hypothetical protein [Candidatus Fermentibacteria bacterium]